MSVDYTSILSNFSASQGKCDMESGPITRCMAKITKEHEKKILKL
jgi:hypothetical protein